ncbi:MAG: transcription-repair coupling factor, partial [Vagococcus sp.]
MYLNKALVSRFGQSVKVKEWQKELTTDSSHLITGLSGSAKTLAIASLLEKQKKILIVTPNLYYASKLMDDLQHIIEEKYLFYFPVDEVTAVEMSFSSPEALADRINALSFLASDDTGILVTSLAGLRRFLPSPNVWKEQSLIFEKDGTLDLGTLAERLVLLGYEKEQMIGKPGEFSIRGSIVDIYPLTSDYPVRLDLFDDEIESLRLFDADTQRSIGEIDHIVIPPAMDTPVTKEALHQASEVLKELVADKVSEMAPSEERGRIEAYFEQIISEWSEGHPTEEVKLYGDLLYPEKTYLTDYLSET